MRSLTFLAPGDWAPGDGLNTFFKVRGLPIGRMARGLLPSYDAVQLRSGSPLGPSKVPPP